MLAVRVTPPGSLIDTSPSSANASSAVTTSPGFQMVPEARYRCECTETVSVAARAATSASAEESDESRAAVGSAMGQLQLVNYNLGAAGDLGYCPNGQEGRITAPLRCRLAGE